MIRLTLPICLVLAALLGPACSNRGDSEPSQTQVTQVTEARNALSEELMLALGQAKNFHGKADVYVKNGDSKAAIAEVERVLKLTFPKDAPEGEDVVLDARARLAKLLIGTGELSRARQVVDTGLGSATRESFFVANLYTVRGELIEAEATVLAESDVEAAKKMRLEAIRAYDKSIEINEAIQKRLVVEDAQ